MSRRRSIGLALLALAAPAAAAAAGDPARGDPAARLAEAEVASDVWELVVRLDDGAWIFAQATVTNAGVSDRDAAVVGHVLDAAGDSHEFHKIKRHGQWRLSADRRAIDLESITLHLARPTARIRVDKARAIFTLEIDLGDQAAWSETLTGPAYGFDLLAVGAPARGTLWVEGMPGPEAVRGRAALTHRWLEAHESELVRRRLEFLALEDRAGLYYTEVTTADGEVRQWAATQRDGRIRGRAGRLLRSEGSPATGAPLRIEGPGLSVRVGGSRAVLRDAPIDRIPWVARWLVSPRARSQWEWRTAPFEGTLGGGEAADLELSGTGVIAVAEFGDGASPARAAGAEGGR